ncbi:protein lin-28 homolog B-like [Anopheles maculipalpis]|uniref:protein lin-28 homolog B-like n=1 Tax=Anopheles maculipalpis TaxID=1496333 RepID=UPI002158DCBF|nr:protein lin-28 homolog B-like [Anopheles maculipalpis]
MATERNGQRCYNCSDFGHHASQWTKPRRTPGSCFKNGSTTHIIRNCPEITKHSPTVAAVQDNEEVGDFEKDGNIVKLDPFQEF